MHPSSLCPYVERMKTSSPTPPKYHFIDIAPLGAQYAALTASMLSLIEAGHMRRVLTLMPQLMRLIRRFRICDTHNYLLALKLEMLAHRPWRECVLKELGGIRKLALWEAARKRIIARRSHPPKTKPAAQPAWLYTPERIAESERLKARVRMCGRASAHPRIFRDRVKVDFCGLFRLAPLPKGPQTTRQIRVYTAETISDYDWNPMLLAKEKGFPPAEIWPAEFHAAAQAEAEIEIEVLGPQGPSSSALYASYEVTEGEEDEDDKIAPWVARGIPLLSPEDFLEMREGERSEGGATA